MELTKVALTESIIKGLYEVIIRRSVYRFDDDPIENSIKQLSQRFPLFSQIQIIKNQYTNQPPIIQVLDSVDAVPDEEMRNAIDSFIRQISYEVYDEIGLYFITEFIDVIGSKVKDAIIGLGVDLHQLQLELHDAYMLGKRSRFESDESVRDQKELINPSNHLRYRWKDVSYWKHESGSVYCNLYDGDGKIIDRINLDRVIKNYIEIVNSGSFYEMIFNNYYYSDLQWFFRCIPFVEA